MDNYDTIVVTFVDASLGRMKSCDFSSRELIYRYTMQICRIIDASLVYVKKVDSSTFASLFTKSREWLNQIGKLLEPFARREIDKLRFEEEVKI